MGGLQTLVNPTSLLNKAKFGVGGIAGTILGTVAIELVSQQIEARVPQTQNVLSRQVVSNAPFLGSVDVRDLAVLGFSIKDLIRFAKSGGKKLNVKTLLANYGTKVILRQQGINPLPDRNSNKLQHKRFSYQLPSP